MSEATSQIVGALRAAGCVYAELEANLLAEAFEGRWLDVAVSRRIAGIPLEQLLGWAEFHGSRIAVEPGVFVPRRRTELLVRQAAARGPSIVVDMCCGSGAVGVALTREVSGIELHATDIDDAAVRCARNNVEPVGGRVHQGDLYSALPVALRGVVDVITANAPYVPTDEIESMPSEARDHEPRTALDGGADGLDLHRRIAAEAPHWLAPGGCLLIETSTRQTQETARIVTDVGFDVAVIRCEELGATVVKASWPNSR